MQERLHSLNCLLNAWHKTDIQQIVLHHILPSGPPLIHAIALFTLSSSSSCNNRIRVVHAHIGTKYCGSESVLRTSGRSTEECPRQWLSAWQPLGPYLGAWQCPTAKRSGAPPGGSCRQSWTP